MPDWLKTSFESDSELSLSMLAARLAVAFALGCVIALVYRVTHGRANGESRGLMATLVLLTVLICMTTLVIGNNVARAFSLVGALAIVRFRTVVADTRDTAFVIFAVSVGMAIGAGFMKVPLAGLPIAAAAAYLFRPRSAEIADRFELTLRVTTGVVSDATVREVLEPHAEAMKLCAMGTARQGSAVESTYALRLKSAASIGAIVEGLNRVQGVQDVSLKRLDA